MYDNTIWSNGKCLTTTRYKSESYVMIYNCETLDSISKFGVVGVWAIHPDSTIRPQKNQDGCLKYANVGEDVSDDTILHVVTEHVMDVKDTIAILPEITVNNYNKRYTQIWFQV
ncbi:hypothetical protein CXB51_035178 [Gossypium anomalum]|uniref:Uncharacterized protein n=1 Tax=Gossypium anomalum TaxID=47600 RepID=A0A8J6CFL0_9ROSI|nr:hypothetical protein CXB51_035178 [Gossypium anomalum]